MRATGTFLINPNEQFSPFRLTVIFVYALMDTAVINATKHSRLVIQTTLVYVEHASSKGQALSVYVLLVTRGSSVRLTLMSVQRTLVRTTQSVLVS